MTSPAAKPVAKAGPLEVFVARAEARACLCREGDLDLHEAVDALQAAAVQTGLVGALGQDLVQAVMTRAFAVVCEPAMVATVSEAAPGSRAAASTIEACMFSLRERGVSALTERDCQRRLAELSTAQVHNIIERLMLARPHFPVIDDELLFLLGEQLT